MKFKLAPIVRLLRTRGGQCFLVNHVSVNMAKWREFSSKRVISDPIFSTIDLALVQAKLISFALPSICLLVSCCDSDPLMSRSLITNEPWLDSALSSSASVVKLVSLTDLKLSSDVIDVLHEKKAQSRVHSSIDLLYSISLSFCNTFCPPISGSSLILLDSNSRHTFSNTFLLSFRPYFPLGALHAVSVTVPPAALTPLC